MRTRTLSTALASPALLGMALSALLQLLFPSLPVWLSGLFGWSTLAFLLLGSRQFHAFTLFFLTAGVGCLLMAWAILRGGEFSLSDILRQNNGLLVMLYCVSFLRLIATAEEAEREPLPRGKRAFLQTLLGIQLLGAVINMSMLILMAERLRSGGALTKQAAVVLSRGFSMAAFWSPFFAAMAIALTYAPGAQLYSILSVGLSLMLISLLVTLIDLGGRQLHKVSDFRGYPLHASSLITPLLIATSVLLLHAWLPTVPVLMEVSLVSVLTTLVILWRKRPRSALQEVTTHVLASGLRMTREVSLFLGAGVLSIGIQTLYATFDWQPFSQFGGLEASLALAAAVLVSLIGVHPVVSVSVLGSLLMPLELNPDLLAALFLCFWALGVVASPFSGLNTILRSHFQVSGRAQFKGNIRYVVVMWLLISLLFFWKLG